MSYKSRKSAIPASFHRTFAAKSSKMKKRTGGKSFGKPGRFSKDKDGKQGFGKRKPAGKSGGFSKYSDKKEGFSGKKSYSDKDSDSKSYGDKKPFGEKRSYGSKSYGDKKPFGRKPYGDKDGDSKSYGDKKPFGEKRSYGSKFSDGEKKPFGEKRSYGGSKSFGDKKPFGRKPYGDKDSDSKKSGDGFEKRSYSKSYGDKKPFGEKRSYGSKPYGDKKPYEKKSYSGKSNDPGSSEGGFEKRSYSKPYGEKKPYGDKKPYEKKSYSDKSSDSVNSEDGFEKRSYSKPYGDKKPYEKKPYARKPYGDAGKEGSDEPKKTYPRKYSPAKKTTVSTNTDGTTRLNKYIANAGVCSRREADELIKVGAVTVNGKVVTEMGYKIGPADVIHYGGELLRREQMVYVLLNKPKDYITTTDDPQKRSTVMELVKDACRERIVPVGRLDRNTTGLLLLTNDGELLTKLTHPKYDIRKIYHVTIDKNLRPEDLKAIEEGVELEDGMIKADEVTFVGDGSDRKEVGLAIHSGRNRVVRRIFEHLGYSVIKLDRVFFAGLTKKDLPRGKWRFLSEAEVGILKMSAGGFESTKKKRYKR
ncbi:MAG: pseudouridine synthase family protein [Bacteroidetes bacterium]|nr:MAG: pseudouridine synthase family protein [Bacteroidota bacterium]